MRIDASFHLCSALHLVVEAPQRLACTDASDNYLVVPYSSPKVRHHHSSRVAKRQSGVLLWYYDTVRAMSSVTSHQGTAEQLCEYKSILSSSSDSMMMSPVCCMQFVEESTGQTAATRDLTVFFMASCTDDMTYKVKDFGMKMRLHMVQRLGADPAPDMFVKCANEHRVRSCALSPATSRKLLPWTEHLLCVIECCLGQRKWLHTL